MRASKMLAVPHAAAATVAVHGSMVSNTQAAVRMCERQCASKTPTAHGIATAL